MIQVKRTAIALLTICVLLKSSAPGAAEVTRQAPKPDGPIVYYDMTALHKLDLGDPTELRRYWDETHLVVSLQGLVNRAGPRLMLPDNEWQEVDEPE